MDFDEICELKFRSLGCEGVVILSLKMIRRLLRVILSSQTLRSSPKKP